MQHVERGFAHLTKSDLGHDDKLFTRHTQFSSIEPSVQVTSSLGPKGTFLPPEFTQDGENRFPPIGWTNPEETKEVVFVVEDPDAPKSTPVVHGLLYGIHPELQELDSSIITSDKDDLKANGIKLGQNYKNSTWAGPYPPEGHGPHRYFFQVISLSEPLSRLEDSGASYHDIIDAIESDKILGWGEWIGVYERGKLGERN